MHSEVAWVLVSLGTQVQWQIILEPGYLPDYLSVFYDYAPNHKVIQRFHHVDLQGHVTNENRNISTARVPMATKLGRMVT